MIGRQKQRPPGGRLAHALDPHAKKGTGGAMIKVGNNTAAAEPDRDPLRGDGGKDQPDQGPGAQRRDQVFFFTSSASGTA